MAARRSKTQWGPMRWCLLMLLALAAVLSSGCAIRQRPPAQAVTIAIPPALAEPCLRPRLPIDDTEGAWVLFGVESEAALGICDSKRLAMMDLIASHRTVVTAPAPKPKRRWLPHR